MIHLHRRFHAKTLARLMTVTTTGLIIFTVAAIVHTNHQDQVFAQSVIAGNVGAQPNPGATQKSAAATKGTQPSTMAKSNGQQAAPSGLAASHNSTVTNANISTNATPSAKPSATPTPTPKATSKPASTTTPVASPAGAWKYPLHSGVVTSFFYAGEPPTADNAFIQNVSSAWQTDWQAHYGGSDDPANRCGYNPCGFTPKENPFYFALPFSDYNESRPVADLSIVYWNSGNPPLSDGASILKNRWIQISAEQGGVTKTVYAQWEDVGPFKEHDSAYVFGTSAPSNTQGLHAGLDVSPATRDYLGMGGSTLSNWRFVDASEVPAGPWKTTITTSAPAWN